MVELMEPARAHRPNDNVLNVENSYIKASTSHSNSCQSYTRVQDFSWCYTSAASRSLVLQSKLAKGSTYPETNFETQTSYREYISRSQLEDFMYVCIFEVAEEQLNIK